jgi:hypothetical protein
MKTLNSYITEKLKINKDYKNPVSSNELIGHILDYPLFKRNLGYKSKNTKGYGEFKPVEYLTRMIAYLNHYPTRNERDIRNSKIEEVQYAINIGMFDFNGECVQRVEETYIGQEPTKTLTEVRNELKNTYGFEDANIDYAFENTNINDYVISE